MSSPAKHIKQNLPHSDLKPNQTTDQLIPTSSQALEATLLPEIDVRPIRTPLAKTPYGKEHLYQTKETAILPQVSRAPQSLWRSTLKKSILIGLPLGVVGLLFGARVAIVALQSTKASTLELIWLALKF